VVVLQHVETASPPMTPLVDARPIFQEHVYQFAIGLLDRDDQGRGAEGSVTHGLVEPSSHGWEGGQHLSDRTRIARLRCCRECLHGIGRAHRLNVRPQPRPASEPVLARQSMLAIGQLR
jgi:hypothetical protein